MCPTGVGALQRSMRLSMALRSVLVVGPRLPRDEWTPVILPKGHPSPRLVTSMITAYSPICCL
jgi:hypothetical protein